LTVTQPEVLLYCDGACSPNPGTGGWGVVLIAPGHEGRRKELAGAQRETTNNRMELTAALMGLRALRRPTRVRILTDSQYLKHAFTQGWIENWERNGWKTSGRTPVKNAELWRALIEAMTPHRVEWAWVKGHHVDEENNRCDALAVEARRRLDREQGEAAAGSADQR
jgi:ribonuclease HI